MKRTVRFVLQVHFEADNEKALKDAIATFKRDPCYQCSGSGEHGSFSWKEGAHRRMERTASGKGQ